MDRMEQAELLWDQASSLSLAADAQMLFEFNKSLTTVTKGLLSLKKAFGKNELKVRNRLAFHGDQLDICAETLNMKNKSTENLVRAKTDIFTKTLRSIETALAEGHQSITQKQSFLMLLEQGDHVTDNFQELYQELKRRMLEAKRREAIKNTSPIITGLDELAINDIDPDEIRAMHPDDALALIQNEIKRLRQLTKGDEGEQTDKLNHILSIYTQLRKELSENQSAETAFKELRHSSVELLPSSQTEGLIEAPVLFTQHSFNKRAFAYLHDDDYDIQTVMGHYVFMRNAELVGVRDDLVQTFAEPSEALSNALEDHSINPSRRVRIGSPIKYVSHWYAPIFPTRVKSLIRIYKWGLATDRIS